MVLPHWLPRFLVSALSAWLLFLAEATTFIFDHFNGSDLILTHDASIASRAIRLTSDSDQMLGHALYSIPLQAKALERFSTTFVFCMVPAPASKGGHGLAFMMTPYASPAGLIGAQYLGLLNTTSNGKPESHLFAVEFDTVLNIEYRDIDNNHVGVDVNSLVSSESRSAGYWIGEKFHELGLNSGQNIQAWIDYDQQQLNVSIAPAGLARPIRPLISVKGFDLLGILQNQTFVGFSAATGTFIEEHDILAWSFSTEGMAPALDVSRLPSFARGEPFYRSARFKAAVSVGFLVGLLLLAAAVFWWVRRRACAQQVEEWELEYWPHRFSYAELRLATRGFRADRLLGSGGYGRVYKGDVPGTGLQVAVKCLNREVTAGMKEFIAEISSMGRLQHRNLVQLRGWSRKDKQLFIVYDYMPNGSLEKFIFGNPEAALGWSQRFKILKGVAAGLLYLHEQWEKIVVHRDIKPSNVLLDSGLNARLGDFGLARLYDHAQPPRTTHVVGTIGYIAPEIAVTGKATPGSDIFSFGVVLLEVACGRRPVEASKGGEALVLVDWIWDLYAEERLLDAADPNLRGEYDARQMQTVLQLGLYCCQSEPEYRPGIRQVLRILDGEAPVPLLQVPSLSSSIFVKGTPGGSCVHVTDESSYASSAMSRSTSG